MIDGVVQRPGYQRISQSAKGNLMQIKGAEASAKLGATAHQNTWQRWSHGQFNYRSGSTAPIARGYESVGLAPESRPTASSINHLFGLAPNLGPLGAGKFSFIGQPPGRDCRLTGEALRVLGCRSRCAVGPRCSLYAKPRIFGAPRRG